MNEIFCLMHSYIDNCGEPEDKILGYFTNEAAALSAVENFIKLPGFRDKLNGFSVERVRLGELFWKEGFETIVDNEPFEG